MNIEKMFSSKNFFLKRSRLKDPLYGGTHTASLSVYEGNNLNKPVTLGICVWYSPQCEGWRCRYEHVGI